jgi:DNA-directed RNA polymerase subunit RPC12/RpoP
MIKTVEAMRAALKRGDHCGVVLYDGPSRIDGKPIIAIACRITDASNNAKTGGMVQTFIMRRDIAPHLALRTGDDSSVCGDCKFRPIYKGKTRCYVRVYQAPLSVWDAYQRGRYAVPGVHFDAALLPELFAGLSFRIGSYGDPAAIPASVWKVATRRVKNRTGYTHQWQRRIGAGLKNLCMASADSGSDVTTATAKGWRTFRVRKLDAPTLENESICPASREGGRRTQCDSCGLCKGAAIAARNVVIADHGLMDSRRHR